MSSRSQRKAARLLGLTGPLLAPLAPGLATQSLLFPFSNAARSQLALLEFLKAIASNIHPLSQHILDSFIFSLCLTSSSPPPPSHCCRHFLSFLKLLSRCPGLPFPPLILQLIPRAYSSGSVWPGFFFLNHSLIQSTLPTQMLVSAILNSAPASFFHTETKSSEDWGPALIYLDLI